MIVAGLTACGSSNNDKMANCSNYLKRDYTVTDSKGFRSGTPGPVSYNPYVRLLINEDNTVTLVSSVNFGKSAYYVQSDEKPLDFDKVPYTKDGKVIIATIETDEEVKPANDKPWNRHTVKTLMFNTETKKLVKTTVRVGTNKYDSYTSKEETIISGICNK